MARSRLDRIVLADTFQEWLARDNDSADTLNAIVVDTGDNDTRADGYFANTLVTIGTTLGSYDSGRAPRLFVRDSDATDHTVQVKLHNQATDAHVGIGFDATSSTETISNKALIAHRRTEAFGAGEFAVSVNEDSTTNANATATDDVWSYSVHNPRHTFSVSGTDRMTLTANTFVLSVRTLTITSCLTWTQVSLADVNAPPGSVIGAPAATQFVD